MTVEDLRKILNDLPNDAEVSIGFDGGDEPVRVVTTSKDLDWVLLCQDNSGVTAQETVLYDATPEPRMD